MRVSKPGQPAAQAAAVPSSPVVPVTAPMPRAVIPAPAPGLMNSAAPPPPAPVGPAPETAAAPTSPPGPLTPANAPKESKPTFAAAPTGKKKDLKEREPRGRLVIIAKDGGEGQSFPIFDNLDVGRSEGDVILGDDRYLSPRHARLFWQRDELVLRDLGSTNGVFLRISKSQNPHMAQPLQDQDLILIGQQVIRFEIVKDAEEGLGPAMQHGTLLFGTPAAPRHARLCQRTVEGVTRDVFHIRKAETVLGRESGDIVFTEDPFLSRRHALIKLDPMRKNFSIGDLGSSNGTFLQIRGDATLKSGDEFRIGQQLFRVNLSQETRSPQASGLEGAPKSVS